MITKVALATIGLVAFAAAASAQTAAPDKPRRFDTVSGIVFACGSATGFVWTGQACDALSAAFRKRAAAAKLPFVEVLITADFAREKRESVGGFDQDKAVRVFWNFVASKDVKGRISAGLSSTVVWEPTAKDIPNVMPGQRFPRIFYTQSVLYDPGVTLPQAQPALDQITDAFFQVGDEKM